MKQQTVVTYRYTLLQEIGKTWTTLGIPTLKHVTCLGKCKGEPFFFWIQNFHGRRVCDSAVYRGELSYLAPLGSENISAPYFKQCFYHGGGCITPQTGSNTTPPSPKTEITNILFYILNLWRRTYCSGLRGCDTREKEIIIWPCWCFHGRYYFYCLKFTLMFINERKRNANTYLISNFDSLETAPSNLRP